MKNLSTIFLKSVILLFGTAVFVLCLMLGSSLLTENVDAYAPVIVVMLTAAIPFFVGEYHTFKLLQYIDQKKAFTKRSVYSLKVIKYAGGVIAVMYAVSMPYIFMVAEQDDAPGVILLGLIFTFVPLAASVFAAILQKVMQDAIDISNQNKLTV